MWKGGEFLNGLPVVTKHFGYIVLTYSLIFIRFLASSQTKPYSLESDFRIERVQIKTVDIHQLTNPVITLVSSLDRNRWLSAVRCLYYINIESSVYPAYTWVSFCLRWFASVSDICCSF